MTKPTPGPDWTAEGSVVHSLRTRIESLEAVIAHKEGLIDRLTTEKDKATHQSIAQSEINAEYEGLEAENAILKETVAGLREMQEVESYLQLEAESDNWAKVALGMGNEITQLKAEKAELLEALQKSENEIENAIIGLRTDPLAYVEAIKQRLEQVLTEVSAALAKAEPESGEKEKE